MLTIGLVLLPFTVSADGELETKSMPGSAAMLEGDLDALDARRYVLRGREPILVAYGMGEDKVGYFIGSELVRAAREGRKPKFIIDRLSIGKPPEGVSWEYLSYLQGEGVEIRIHRPPSFMGLLRRGFSQLNQRMHTKLLTNADGELVTGSRNLNDFHFGLDPKLDHAHMDIDALVRGGVVKDARDYQELLWKSTITEPLMPGRLRPERIAYFQDQHAAVISYFEGNGLIGSIPKNWPSRLIQVEDVKFIYDHKLRTNGSYQGSLDGLIDLLREAKAGEQLLMEAQYFIPDEELIREFEAAVKRGVKVKVLANGWNAHLGGGDSMIRSVYEDSMKRLAKAGIEVAEFQGIGKIHSKAVVLGNRKCNVWSHNIDNRSKVHNLEAGVQITGEAFCSQFASRIEQRFSMARTAIRNGNIFRGENCRNWFHRVGSRLMRPVL